MLISIIVSPPDTGEGIYHIIMHIKGDVESSVVDIPFASCAFPPVQFDSNLTRQLYNQPQGDFNKAAVFIRWQMKENFLFSFLSFIKVIGSWKGFGVQAYCAARTLYQPIN